MMRWLVVAVLAVLARAGEAPIDGFEGPIGWTANPDGGTSVRARLASEHVKGGKSALRLSYTDAPPHWANLQHPVAVPPDATAIALWLHVHSAAPAAAMHFWLLEPDGDAWVTRVPATGPLLGEMKPGWHELVVPIGAFHFEPRGRGTRQMVSANRMLIGCNFGDLDVTIDELRFLTRGDAQVAKSERTEGLRFEEGQAGRVAVMADDLPGSRGSASPQKLAELARGLGYGATLLRGGDVVDPAVLSREHFDALVIPCAPAYPRDGRGALLGFLKAGGSLVSIGGYAFDLPVAKSADGWAAFDPGLRARDMDKPQAPADWFNTRHGRPGDTMGLDPDQIGAFDPSYVLEHVAYATIAPDQALLKDDLRIDGALEGYAACAMTGSNNPCFPKVHGRWVPILNTFDSLGRPRGAAAAVVHNFRGPFAGSSWALFGVTNRDLIGDEASGPRLFAAALRAVVRPVYLHGLATELACYRQGETVRVTVQVTNRGRAPREVIVRFRCEGSEAIERRVSVGAEASVSAEAELSAGKLERDFYKVEAELLNAANREAIDRMATAFAVWDEAAIKAGPKIALKDNYLTWNGVPRFVVGTNQTGMIWYSEHENPLVWERDFAKMEASGIRMLRILHFSPFAAGDPTAGPKMGVLGLKSFVDAERKEKKRVEDEDEGRGRGRLKMMRQTDAIVQLAQKHGIAIFLSLHDWQPVELSDAELEAQREWARFWAERYRNVPGILYDVQNEPTVGLSQAPDIARFYNEWLSARYSLWGALRAAWGGSAPQGEPWTLRPEAGSTDWSDVKALDANRFKVATLNRWIKANVEGVKAGNPDALVTVGFLPSMPPADKVLGVAHSDFSNMHYYGGIDHFPLEFKLTDRRFLGKALSLGEYGAEEAHNARVRGETGTRPEESIRRFLATVHYVFGLGGAFALNWDWKEFDDCVFPWGLCHPCDLLPKPVLLAYRNMGLFLERLRPRYQDPGLYLLIPDSHRLGGRWNEVHAAIFRSIDGLLANHADFNMANEDDLERLPATCRTILWPIPYCPEDKAFERVLAFVRAGGTLYLSGDVAYDAFRRRTRTQRLADLGLKDAGERTPFSNPSLPKGSPLREGIQQDPAAYPPEGVKPSGGKGGVKPSGGEDVQRTTVGQGKVYYIPRPVELEGGSLAGTYREFLAFAGVRPISVQPNNPRLHVFTVPLEVGAATVVCNRTGARQEVRLAGAQLTVGENLTGLVVTGARGEITGIECTGGSATADGPITEGDAHVLVASLDGADLRQSRRLMVLPVTEGQLAVRTAATWRNPALDVGEFEGSAWRTLAATPLRPEAGSFRLKLDGSLLRSILVIRESDR